jgi:neutral ceramidase
MAGNRPRPLGQGVQWSLCGRVLVVDDGTRRIAIVCLDLMALPAEQVAKLRTRLAALGGLDPGNIIVACTHTHRAPRPAT